MIISTLYRCDMCGEKANGASQDLPEDWKKQGKKDLCRTCIRISGIPVNNLSQERLRKEFEAKCKEVFTVDRLRRLRS